MSTSLIEIRHKENTCWYLLQTKYQQENRAAKELERQDISVFLPLYKLEKIIHGKRVIKEEPLFSRYLFIQFNSENINWTSIRSTRGVSHFVGFGDGPTIVDETIIEGIMNLKSPTSKPSFNQGDEVRIAAGPLKDLSAIFQVSDGLTRSKILLTFMHQNQNLSIDNRLLVKI